MSSFFFKKNYVSSIHVPAERLLLIPLVRLGQRNVYRGRQFGVGFDKFLLLQATGERGV